MNEEQKYPVEQELTTGKAVWLSVTAVAAFQLAYGIHALSFLIAVYLWCVFELTRLPSARQASYFGLGVAMLAYAPQSLFLWKIFGPAAVALWFVLAFWVRMFVILGRSCRQKCGRVGAALLIPFLWTGLEFFRSECYYLRFSWYNAGYVFSDNLQWLPMRWLGMYGFGFALMAAISLMSLTNFKKRLMTGTVGLAALGLLVNLPPLESPSIAKPPGNLTVAGVQLEFPSEAEVTDSLDKLVRQHPEAQLLVLSEYTIDGPVPDSIKAWCWRHDRYLIIGAKDPAANGDFYDTAFVVGPDGQIVFRQGKSVPVQFFKDGLPAKEQKVWESWGRIGLCICYDLSYTRVTDGLIREGAEAIIVPTMDVVNWGPHQHELHARVAPVRAAEYGVPIFRVASSGISQCVDAAGRVTATAPMPGDGAMLSGTLDLKGPGHLPWDRVVAPLSAWVTGGYLAWLGIRWWPKKRFRFRPEAAITSRDARRNSGTATDD
jgi:apolipoprotein N-acyltransferase